MPSRVSKAPGIFELLRSAALILEDSLKDQAADMRRDLNTIFFKHEQLNRERSRVFALKANLEARKKWLEENEPKNEE